MTEPAAESKRILPEPGFFLGTNPQAKHFIALLIGAFALFWGTGTAYYHFFRLHQIYDLNLYTRAVVSLHDGLGVWAVLLLSIIPFVWAMFFFFTEKVEQLPLKAFGWLAAGGLLSILCGLAGTESGGSFGFWVAAKMQGVFGRFLATLILIAAESMALFLATERFFSQRRASPLLPAVEPVSESEVAVTQEEAAQISSVAVQEEPATTPAPAVEQAEVSPLAEAVAIPPKQVRRRREKTAPVSVAEERIDLEKILEIPKEPEKPVAPEAVAVEEKPLVPETREEKSAELEAAVERATKDYVLPSVPVVAEQSAPLPETESVGILDRAARLVIAEGRGSVSLLQRRLSVPFSRASLLLDLLEKEGVIGPYRGGPAREVLLRLDDWEAKQKAKAQETTGLAQA